jgi:hypothetical protein
MHFCCGGQGTFANNKFNVLTTSKHVKNIWYGASKQYFD